MNVGTISDTESGLSQVLADIMGVEQVALDGHFFEDLGANSLLMAQFCARVRKQDGLPSVSIKDVYRNPTISSLATALADTAATPSRAVVLERTDESARVSRAQYFLCGMLQLLLFLGSSWLVVALVARGVGWLSEGSGFLDYYLRSAVLGCVLVAGLAILPIGAKWLLIGRWRPQQIRVWSLAYLRFWLVKTLIQKNILLVFLPGSPLYPLYLRALGAKVGRGVTIFSKHVPVCTDLLTVGDGVVIRKDTFVNCYRARAGQIQIGTVTIGKDAFVGEMTVIDIDTSVGDGAQVGHSSSLYAGQAVPGGELWHGSPAQRADVDYRMGESVACGTLRRALYVVRQLLYIVLLAAPLVLGSGYMLSVLAPRIGAYVSPEAADGATWTFCRDALIASLVLFVGVRLFGFIFMVTVPRILNVAIKPDKVYPLYGFHYFVHKVIRFSTNRKFFNTLFGDSSYIVHYLRGAGWDLSRAEQTGSNFGLVEKCENPYLCTVGSGTVIADGLSIVNADYSSTSFRLSKASIGARNFLGNNIVFPGGAKIGDNCLLATKVLVPIDGEVREGVGLLGSPSFEIPRSVERDLLVGHPRGTDQLRSRLAAKNRHNTAAMGVFLLTQWAYLFGALMLGSVIDAFSDSSAGQVIAVGVIFAELVFSVVYFAMVERLAILFSPLRPLHCSIYDRRFWRHERFWKVSMTAPYLQVFNGTPFKSIVWRMLGVRLGKRAFDDGCHFVEKTLVTLGDDVTLNVGSVIQCHSQEDGSFKLDGIKIGDRCTVGTGALVHYGVTMGDDVVLEADSFLMKGEEVPARARWGGNPAREMSDDNHQLG